MKRILLFLIALAGRCIRWLVLLEFFPEDLQRADGRASAAGNNFCGARAGF